MIRLLFDERFTRSIKRLDSITQKRTEKALMLFIENPRHPSLNFEVVISSERYHTIRVDRGRRILLDAIEPTMFRVFDIGSHDYIYRRYG